MIPAGFEPATVRLEGVCSIQLSYRTKILSLIGPSNYRRTQFLRKNVFSHQSIYAGLQPNGASWKMPKPTYYSILSYHVVDVNSFV